MQKFSTFSERTIKHHHKPNASRFISEDRAADYDMELFFVASESFPHISNDSIRLIDSSKHASSPKSFFDIIDLPESELPLFMQSLYKTRESSALFPIGRKILAVYTPLLRSCGLGIAFIFNYTPSYVSALLELDNSEFLSDILISPTFKEYPKRSCKAMVFANSLMGVACKLNKCLEKSTASADSAVSIITSVADLIGIPVTVELQLDDMGNRAFDTRALCTFSISLLSMAKRLSDDHSATFKISGGRQRSMSFDFDLRQGADPKNNMIAALFCEKAADELRVPFFADIENGHFHSEFAPFREDPSLLGLKSGIFIDQKRITPIL